ncbi:MAG: glycosyltransferase family 9 protein [Elusimicrobiota bacterium]
MLALSDDIQDVVLLWIGRIGDLLISTPAVAAVRGKFPAARITLITGEQGIAAARLIPDVDEVRVLGRFHRPLANLALTAGLAARRADLLIDLNPSFSRSAWMLARLASARVKIAFRKKHGNGAFSHLLEAPGEKEHMLDRYGRLAQAIDAPYAPTPRIRLTEADRRAAAAALRAIGAPAAARLVGIFPGNFKKRENRWPREKFAAFAGRLQEMDGLFPFFMAGPGETAAVQDVAARLNRPLPVLEALPLGAAAALLRELHIFAGNCTGTTHLAIAAGAPTFSLLSRYTQTVWMPRPSGAAPHFCAVAEDWESCRDIPVETALAAFRDALSALRCRG